MSIRTLLRAGEILLSLFKNIHTLIFLNDYYIEYYLIALH